LRTPDFRVIDSAACFPEDNAFVGMIDKYAIHGQLSSLVDEVLAFGAFQRGVASSYYESFVAFQPADFEKVGACTGWADVGDVVRDCACVEGFLDSCHYFDVVDCSLKEEFTDTSAYIVTTKLEVGEAGNRWT
jgi:hypothetical protein